MHTSSTGTRTRLHGITWRRHSWGIPSLRFCAVSWKTKKIGPEIMVGRSLGALLALLVAAAPVAGFTPRLRRRAAAARCRTRTHKHSTSLAPACSDAAGFVFAASRGSRRRASTAGWTCGARQPGAPSPRSMECCRPALRADRLADGAGRRRRRAQARGCARMPCRIAAAAPTSGETRGRAKRPTPPRVCVSASAAALRVWTHVRA